MSNIIYIAIKKKADDEKITGAAICKHCNHVWSATSKALELGLTCPLCGGDASYFYGVKPTNGKYFFCKCGNDSFLIQPHRVMCRSCGATTTWEVLADVADGYGGE